MKFELDIEFVRETKEFVASSPSLSKKGTGRSARGAISALLLDQDNTKAINFQGIDELLETPGSPINSKLEEEQEEQKQTSIPVARNLGKRGETIYLGREQQIRILDAVMSGKKYEEVARVEGLGYRKVYFTVQHTWGDLVHFLERDFSYHHKFGILTRTKFRIEPLRMKYPLIKEAIEHWRASLVWKK